MFGVATYHEPAAFLEHAGDWLLRREDCHNLFLTLSHARADSGRAEDGTMWAVVEREGRVLGCALRLPPYKALLTDVPAGALPELTRSFANRFEQLPAVCGPVEAAERFATHWVELRGGGWQRGMEQGVYRLDKVDRPRGAPGRMRLARPDDSHIAIDWGRAFARETGVTFPTAIRVVDAWIRLGFLFVWEDRGRPVSIAVAHGRTRRGVRIGYVYTPPEERSRGYASALVAEVSEGMLDQGYEFCVLYADLANATSNAIYRSIGYRLIERVCDVDLVPRRGG